MAVGGRVAPVGLSETTRLRPSATVERADGSFESTRHGVGTTFGRRGPDAQWGAFAEATVESDIFHGPVVTEVERTSEAILADPADPLSLVERTDRVFLNGREYTSHYDATTRRLTRTTPTGRTSILDVDQLGRPVLAQLGDLEPVSFSYDSRGRLEAIVQGSGLDERTLGLGYDLLGRLETITDPLSRTVTFDYDAANRVEAQELPDARAISFGWDENGNLVSLTPPGQPAHGFVPNLVDQVASYAPPAVPGGGSTTYSYDLDRFLTGLLRPDLVEVSFERDIQGRLREIETPLGSYLYQYPALTADDRVTEAEAPDGGTIAYGWNGPYLMSTTWAGAVSGSVARTYDANGRIASRSVNGASTATFDYDDDGLLEQAGALAVARDAATGLVTGTTLGSVTTAMAYNSFGERPRPPRVSPAHLSTRSATPATNSAGSPPKPRPSTVSPRPGSTATTSPAASTPSNATTCSLATTATTTTATAPRIRGSGARRSAATTPRIE